MAREAQLLRALQTNEGAALSSIDLVAQIYGKLAPQVVPAGSTFWVMCVCGCAEFVYACTAQVNALLHLKKLAHEGKVESVQPSAGEKATTKDPSTASTHYEEIHSAADEKDWLWRAVPAVVATKQSSL